MMEVLDDFFVHSKQLNAMGDELLPNISADDWINQLQVLDLPQFFTNGDELDKSSKYYSISSPDQVVADNSNDRIELSPSPSEISAIIQQQVTKEIQHHIAGPIKHVRTKIETSPTTTTPTISSVTLSREQLLSFTSDDLDAFEKKITSVRSLTSAERKEMKRQRRLIKNRESAQQSRRRKKDRVDELETIVEDLNGINKTLNTKLSDLEAESTILKAEVSQLVGVIRDSPALSDLLRNVTSMLIFYALQASKAQKLALSPVLPLHSHNSIEAC